MHYFDEDEKEMKDVEGGEPENVPDKEPEEKPEEKPEETPEEKSAEEPERYGYDGYNYGGYSGREKKKEESYMSKKTVGWIVALCLVISIICGVCAGAVTGALKDSSATTTPSTTVMPIHESTTQSKTDSTTQQKSTEQIVPIDTSAATNIPQAAFAGDIKTYACREDMVEDCVKSVVIIDVTEIATDIFGDQYEKLGHATGVVYSTDGYIVTNYHVAGKDTISITVTFNDGTKYEGQFICGDSSLDIAIVKVNKNDCVAARFGDSSKLRLSSDVVVIGNALGEGITVTKGTISAMSRKVVIGNATMTLMQTDATINEGNSGGGMFNMAGELVGIPNAKICGETVESTGYAIPSANVVKYINDFSQYGYVTGLARLGISANPNGIVWGSRLYSGVGVKVSTVVTGGTADVCGIKTDDIISSVNGVNCSSFATLTEILTGYKVGDTVTMRILRPTEESSSQTNFNNYLRTCETVDIEVTFIEFNPDK